MITAVLAIALAGAGSLSQVPLPVTRATERAVSFLQQRMQEFPDLFRRAGWDRCEAPAGAKRE